MCRLRSLIVLCAAVVASVCSPTYAGEHSSPTGRKTAQLLDLSTQGSKSDQLLAPGSVLVLQDAPDSLGIDDVAAAPEDAFKPFNPKKPYLLNGKTALWLYFRVQGTAASSAQDFSFELPKPFVDRVEFYYRNGRGGWDKKQAGDQVPQARWAVRGMHPHFALPNLQAGVNEFYVKVNQLFPLRFDVTLKTTEQASFDNQNSLLLNSILLGLLLFIATFGLVLAIANRSAAYGWYALYVIFVFFSIAAYVGIGFYAFWPDAVLWPEMSHLVCLTVALTFQLQFCRAMFLGDDTRSTLSRVTLLGAVLSVVAILAVLPSRTSEINFRLSAVLAPCTLLLLLMFTVVIKAAWQRNRTAWLWIVAYLPVSVCLGFTLVEQLGWAALPWLPYNAIGFGVAFEVMVLLLALHLHVKSNQAREVRKMTLVELDSLTGFVAPRYYPDTLTQLWSETRHLRQDLAVAYVRAEFDFEAGTGVKQLGSDELVLRCVRMLRMVTRPDDVVARIGANVFAIVMPGISPGPNFAGKLSRLVALGLMRDPDDSAALPVKFRVAATSFSSFSGTSSLLDKALKQKLFEFNASSERGIEFIKNR